MHCRGGQLAGAQNAGQVAFFPWGWTADFVDPATFLQAVFYSKSKFNRSRYSDPAFDALIEKALAHAGATFQHVVRTRMFLAHVEDWEEVGRAHGEVFGTIRPASTMVVAAMLNPKWRVEIEAEAVLP